VHHSASLHHHAMEGQVSWAQKISSCARQQHEKNENNKNNKKNGWYSLTRRRIQGMSIEVNSYSFT